MPGGPRAVSHEQQHPPLDTPSGGSTEGLARGRRRWSRTVHRQLQEATVCPAPKRRRRMTVKKVIKVYYWVPIVLPFTKFNLEKEISQYQGVSGDRKQGFKAAVDEERAEQPHTVVSEVFEGQLEDVSPANAAKINLFSWTIGSTAQHKELGATAFDLFQMIFNICSGQNKPISISGVHQMFWIAPASCFLHWQTYSCALLPLCSYNDHSEEGKAHEDTLHLDELHGVRQSFEDGGVEAWD